MSASMNLKIRLGPLVSLEVNGDNCEEIRAALDGFEMLNTQLDAMCSDLAGRIYPDEQESMDQSS